MDVTETHDGLIKLGSPASHAGNRGSTPLGAILFNTLQCVNFRFPICVRLVSIDSEILANFSRFTLAYT